MDKLTSKKKKIEMNKISVYLANQKDEFLVKRFLKTI